MAQLSVSEKQQEFLTSEARVVALVCGIGFGKSFIASEKAAQLVANGGHVVAMSQSYKQLDIVLMQEIQERLRGHGIEFKYNKQKMIIDVPATGGKVFGFSAKPPYSTSIAMTLSQVDCVEAFCPTKYLLPPLPVGVTTGYSICAKEPARIIFKPPLGIIHSCQKTTSLNLWKNTKELLKLRSWKAHSWTWSLTISSLA
jgi:hypothetical protein